MVKAQWDLPESTWFLKIVDKWYFRYEGDTIEDGEDALESYYRICVNHDSQKKQ